MKPQNRTQQIGIDRLVRLAWLEKVSSLVLAGIDQKNIKLILQNELAGAFRSANTEVRGSLDKTITILLKVWLIPPKALEPLRIDGLEFLKNLPLTERLVIHWGMVAAVYPFWAAVALQVGRLLRLQGSVTAAHIQRRIREQYGERETVSRRTRYIIRSYSDWGVLQETATKGTYTSGLAHAIDDTRLIAWLTETALHARANGSVPLKDLMNSPAFFPFRIKPVSAESLVKDSSRLDILRHGLDDDLVMLRKASAKSDI